ncbi:CitMHS family transporter [Fusobacterium ulcerans]|jgi:CitMHS family citrate-Mg2+:H+ or citrate-Ca2+:H+ symporter|uniref:Citrate transporter n=1 Tax=Fusobacterium ulcerans TaxID=861 RepID=A0AAX1TP55_9FUSO|nr:citrate:proton symporter [Fusobacterium ulcerans]AVQ26979.1 citrate transporter [Fusobacterium ulcerans]EFS24896.1 citrate transporter [Fusobacterium ulcerans ATCC 49185]MCB8566058.1 citrate:proton symporter [Fusobacterium ulcerans]MCB8650065.1 citrate:proton symporter [Fusobacterium ulcerans]MEE0138289.1 citrate:proton symporter [Fusobacterium ulcerans]
MVAALGFITIIVLLAVIMLKKMSPLVALISVPVITALIGGHGLNIGKYINDGVKSIAPTGTMFIFAILFFGILTDAGTFQPIIDQILKIVGKDPIKIAIGTAILAMIVHLDGSGAVTFLVTVPAMLPLYEALGMRKTTLATIVALGAGVMNILPWGGPTIRAATSLKIPVTELFNPLLIPVLAGILFVLFVAFKLGRDEKIRIGNIEDINIDTNNLGEKKESRNFIVNILTIIVAIVVLVSGKLSPTVVFMIAFCISIVINFPSVKEQKERVDAHAKAALMMASILFAAGAFIGIMQKSGMITEMSTVIVKTIPQSLGSYMAVITGVISMPASLLFDPDSFYFGVMPVLATTAQEFGSSAIAVGRAAILGQMTTGFPVSPLTASTFLLVGLTGVELGEHQKKTIPYAFLTTIVMLIVAIVTGALYR